MTGATTWLKAGPAAPDGTGIVVQVREPAIHTLPPPSTTTTAAGFLENWS
ncbi:hypothetical protein [Micromonospora sp. WMMD712]|nr:hypothetical protein [Micromonospora sp. WMMD712]WFE60060.1 hypothetical protein O7633_25860 [Micromonospora sp. WMMD712]